MDNILKWISSLPPLPEFFPPSPKAYSCLLFLFQYFPLITIAQWILPFYPQGKTSLASSLLNFPGRYAWCFMESTGLANMAYILYTHHQSDPNLLSGLPFWNKTVLALYVLHYINRAVVTPLFIAPSMSPIHLIIIFMAVAFNYFNSSCITSWLLGYGLPLTGSDNAIINKATSPSPPWLQYAPYLGLGLYFLGMYGNIHAEGILFRLRKEEAHRRQKEQKEKHIKNTKSIYDKVYIIPPPKGVFHSILFPHYVLEWFEWIGFVLVAFAVVEPTKLSETPSIPLAPYYTPLAKMFLQDWGLPFPFPVIVFLVNVVLTTGARAVWGKRWYVQRFGKKAVAGRGAFVPYFNLF